MQGTMSCDDTEQHQLDAGIQDSHEARRPSARHYSSAHSSRSSSFNAGAAEIILGLFRKNNIAHIEPSYYDEDDPTVREALILQLAQNPDSWVSKSLARPELWEHSELEASTILKFLSFFQVSEQKWNRAIQRKVTMLNDHERNHQ
jgi:hypothetical protein